MSLSRRQVLTAVAASAVGVALTGCSAAAPSGGTRGPAATGAAVHPVRHHYGSDASQFGDLYTPTGHRCAGTVVLLHGGYWQAQYDLSLMAPLAIDLARRGWQTWNLEYRRVGDGGGWPGTFDDVAAGIDVLAAPALNADLSKVAVVGHSAGGQLAAWAASRGSLPASAPGASPRVEVTGVVSLAGVLDLRSAAKQNLGGGAVQSLLGGSPSAVPSRYRDADPIELLPLGVPVRCIHGVSDDIVPLSQDEKYVAAARAKGDDVRLTRVSGDHFTLIDPNSAAWKTTVAQLAALMR